MTAPWTSWPTCCRSSAPTVLAALSQLLDVQNLLAATQARLGAVLSLLRNPLALLLNPGLLIESLRLQALVPDLQAQVQQKLDALVSLVNIGLGLLVLRLPTSETAGGPLPAHVWAVYDLPGRKRLSIGFDGLRRGTTLPNSTLGIFTFGAAKAAQGVAGVPARFDADFGDGTFRFRGLSGPLAAAKLSITNHSGTTAPTGQGSRGNNVARRGGAHSLVVWWSTRRCWLASSRWCSLILMSGSGDCGWGRRRWSWAGEA